MLSVEKGELLKQYKPPFYLFDKLTLGYLVIVPVMFFLFGRDMAAWPVVLKVHPFIIIAILLLIRYEQFLFFPFNLLRSCYPIILLTFFFSIIGRSVNILFPNWLEPYLIENDLWLFGRLPWQIFSEHMNPFMTEIFAFSYSSYYFIIPLYVLLHYKKMRSAPSSQKTITPSFEGVMARICLVMFSCYIFFWLMPARGPHHVYELSHKTLFSGGFFFNSILAIQSQASIVGAAFPSGHVAAAWTLLLTLRHNFKKIFWFSFPIIVLLSISTFTLQYHYFADSIAGILLAIILEIIMSYREKRLSKTSSQPSTLNPSSYFFKKKHTPV